uniref:Eukaryotic translation initiation factor 2 subunit 2 n=1 Tax=Trichuris muris TaxID=70415 RepID=A0A5S6QMN6_TRIMR
MDKEQATFDPGMKKKKKKKELVLEPVENVQATAEEEPPALDDFSKLKKKKKKPQLNLETVDVADGAAGSAAAADGVAESCALYSYEQLLQRVYAIMHEKNPDLVTGEKKKFVMKPPEVLRVGSKKTAFANFAEICRLLKRTPKHVLAFLLAELGTSGSIDGNDQLIMKGRFQQKHFESVLRKYIREYVTCHTCKSADTVLDKDTRLFFLQCQTCGSRCSVATIKSGFQAVTTRRAQTRAATGV